MFSKVNAAQSWVEYWRLRTPHKSQRLEESAMQEGTTTRQQWDAPQLVRFGVFRELTEQGVNPCNKGLGASDGFTFNGQIIVCSRS